MFQQNVMRVSIPTEHDAQERVRTMVQTPILDLMGNPLFIDRIKMLVSPATHGIGRVKQDASHPIEHGARGREDTVPWSTAHADTS